MSIHDFDRLEQFHKKNLDWFVVNWCLGNTCNYACSYCPVSLHDGSHRWHATANIKRFVEQVKSIHPTKKIYFEFTGGEVTLNKEFVEIAKFCHENEVRVGLISNGSRTLRWWQQNKQYFNHLNISYHVEFAKPDYFYEVVEEVRLDMATHVNIMMHPERWDECMAIASRLKPLGDISIALQPLIHDLAHEMYDYTAEQRHIFDHQHELFGKIPCTKHYESYRGLMRGLRPDGSFTKFSAHEFIANGTNNWRGWHCWAGVEQLIVDMDGSIWRGWCKVGGPLGNVGDPMLELPVDPIVCRKNICHCNFDIMSTKVRLPGGV